MSASTPVERVAQILQEAGYERRNPPLVIGGIKFDVSGAFVGGIRSQDLIIIGDTAFDDEQRILRNVQAIARALDVAASTRPLTVVIAGPRPTASTMEALSRVSRVLPVGVAVGSDLEAALKNWLAVLLPLNIPKSRQAIADPIGEVSWEARDMSTAMASLLLEVPGGKEAVEKRLYDILKAALVDTESDDAT